jgi:hypothetical protein
LQTRNLNLNNKSVKREGNVFFERNIFYKMTPKITTHIFTIVKIQFLGAEKLQAELQGPRIYILTNY